MKNLLLVVLLFVCSGFAQTFEVDGIKYNIFFSTGTTVEVVSKNPKYVGSVTIPATVVYNTITYSITTIGYKAFSECTGLTSITIPNSVKTIGIQAFYNCVGLTNVTIPNSVTTIGGNAFFGCSGLTSVTIPSLVTAIGVYTFGGCSGLTSIEVEANNPNYSSLNGVLYNKNRTELLQYPGRKNGDFDIPNSVTTIKGHAFDGCSGLASVIIPNSVTTIGEWAFAHSGLTSVSIGNSVTTIGSQVFYDCKSLTSVTIGNSVTTIGDQTFRYCSGLTSLMIPNSVITIGEWAFADCDSLASVMIPNSVTTIGNYAFNSCSDLTSVTIPNSVITIGGCAFLDCSSLTSVSIGNSVTTIGESAFAYCNGLTSVMIGSSVATIGDYAFGDCSSLVSIEVVADNPNYSSLDGVLYNKARTVLLQYPRGKNGNFDIPNSVTTIGDYAFGGCVGLTSVTIPNSITTIEYQAFGGCISLTSVMIPNSVTAIGHYAFAGSGLTNVTIPNSVTTIEVCTFIYCTSLTSVTIPNSVTNIGEWAFLGCFNLSSITTLAAIPPSLGPNVFSSVPTNIPLYVPNESISAYQNAAQWKDFIVTPISNIVSGVISQNTTWGGDTIKVAGNITVADGVKLTIQPGTVIAFTGNYNIRVEGLIQAIGTATDKIKFIPATGNPYWQGINYPENADNDSSAFVHCIFQHSQSGSNGGVFNVQRGNRIVVADCVAEDDKAANNGGFICANEADITIINSVIRRNTAGISGGALYLENCTLTMINNTFNHNNAVQNGGAVVFNNTDGNVYNSIFWSNNAADNGQICLTDNNSDPNFYNNNLAGGFQGITGTGSENNFSGIYLNNINADPMFSEDEFGFNLNSNSPCVNSGIQSKEKLTLPTCDINGSPRIAQGTVDIGASEYVTTDISNQTLISGYALEQNYPNPFNPETVIAFTLPVNHSDKVSIKICNIKGEMVKNLEYKNLAAGRHQVVLNLADCPSGIYFYTIKTANFQSMKRMVLVK